MREVCQRSRRRALPQAPADDRAGVRARHPARRAQLSPLPADVDRGGTHATAKPASEGNRGAPNAPPAPPVSRRPRTQPVSSGAVRILPRHRRQRPATHRQTASRDASSREERAPCPTIETSPRVQWPTGLRSAATSSASAGRSTKWMRARCVRRRLPSHVTGSGSPVASLGTRKTLKPNGRARPPTPTPPARWACGRKARAGSIATHATLTRYLPRPCRNDRIAAQIRPRHSRCSGPHEPRRRAERCPVTCERRCASHARGRRFETRRAHSAPAHRREPALLHGAGRAKRTTRCCPRNRASRHPFGATRRGTIRCGDGREHPTQRRLSSR